MNYRDLKAFCDSLTEEQLDKTATVHDTYDDEYIAVFSAYAVEDGEAGSEVIDCTDVPHPVLELKG